MSVLFSPMKIGELEIKNRFVRSATFEGVAALNGEVTDQLVKTYSTLAKGGTGLIITGHMSVQPSGRAHLKQTGIHSDDMVPGLKRMAQAVHERDGKIFFQLSHAGRQTNKEACGQLPMAPSSGGLDPSYLVKPKEMSEDDIREAIKAFGNAARRAADAGADGVQIHGAHGYLVNQFLSPFFNRRKDRWGGSDENRFRFLEELLVEIKKSAPEGTPVVIKLNTNDYTPRQGITPELAKYYARRLVETGIDAVEISSGTASYSFMNCCRGDVPVRDLLDGLTIWLRPIARIMLKRLEGKYDLGEGYHLEAAKALKPVLRSVPLILVGGMRRVNYMEEVLEAGHADFISMSRPFLREPFLVKRIKDGKSDRARCVSCNRCLAAVRTQAPIRCFHSQG